MPPKGKVVKVDKVAGQVSEMQKTLLQFQESIKTMLEKQETILENQQTMMDELKNHSNEIKANREGLNELRGRFPKQMDTIMASIPAESTRCWDQYPTFDLSLMEDFIKAHPSPELKQWCELFSNLDSQRKGSGLWYEYMESFLEVRLKLDDGAPLKASAKTTASIALETNTPSKASSSAVQKHFVAPKIWTEPITDAEMAVYFTDANNHYKVLNKSKNFRETMIETNNSFFSKAFSVLKPSSELEYQKIVYKSVYEIGQSSSESFFGYTLHDENELSFEPKIGLKRRPYKLKPDLDALYYLPATPGQKSGVIVGEVNKPSIKPVVELLEKWSGYGEEIDFENQKDKHALILNQLLIYMIVGQCPTGLLTDSRIYIYLKLNPTKSTSAILSLSYYVTEASNEHKKSISKISPRAAMISMIGSVVLCSQEDRQETIKMFSSLKSWAKKEFVSKFFSTGTVQENFGYFKNSAGYNKSIDRNLKPILDHIEMKLVFKDEYEIVRRENSNSSVYKFPTQYLREVLDGEHLRRIDRDNPESVVTKVFDHNFVMMTHAHRTYERLMDDMIKIYCDELDTYHEIGLYNSNNEDQPINMPKVYGNGFFSIRNETKPVSEDTDYIASGPCIVMEHLEKKELNSHQQFDLGLQQLARMHNAGIAHQDIKEDNIRFRDNEFIFIDYGLSTIFKFYSEKSSKTSEPQAKKEELHTTVSSPVPTQIVSSPPRRGGYQIWSAPGNIEGRGEPSSEQGLEIEQSVQKRPEEIQKQEEAEEAEEKDLDDFIKLWQAKFPDPLPEDRIRERYHRYKGARSAS